MVEEVKEVNKIMKKKRGLASADEQTRQRVAQAGGNARAQDPDVKSGDLGRKGGKAAQRSGHAHKLTNEERSKGGSMSAGNFANDPYRASVAGKKGGKASKKSVIDDLEDLFS